MITRSQFLLRGALAAGAAASGPWVAQAAAQAGAGDVELLNFALGLEHLESGLYARAKDVPGLSRKTRALARELGGHEAEHVEALIDLIGRLGGDPDPAPTLRLDDALRSEAAFLRAAQQLEDTGVGAYNGAAPLLLEPAVLAIAGAIVQVEARHAAAIRELRGEDAAPQAFDAPLGVAAVRRNVMPFVS